LRETCPCPVTVVGTGNAEDLSASQGEEQENGLRFRLANVSFTVPIHGKQNIGNILLAIAVARYLGTPDSVIAEKLGTFRLPERTFDVRNECGATILDATHNASPESFRAAIAWAKNRKATQKVLLSTGVIELGHAEARTHEELGALAATVFDKVIFTNPRFVKHFERGYRHKVEIQGKQKETRLPPDSLLVCIGRLPQATITHFLPK
jgi:UDP-N-acetylmuramoyl-tripeptide--D-alanyl-D-alanine ligase